MIINNNQGAALAARVLGRHPARLATTRAVLSTAATVPDVCQPGGFCFMQRHFLVRAADAV